MLVTLLLCNAAAMETLPIFLDKVVSPVDAVLFSVSLVLIFGEIIPQAVCTGPKQLEIAFQMCPVVLFLMWVTFPISWPIAKILDFMLGEHHLFRYNNDQLKKLVMLHSIHALKKVEDHLPQGIQGLTGEQTKMVEGCITFQTATCGEVMTSISKVRFTLTMETILNEEMLIRIKQNGFSRIPIIKDGDNNLIVAVLLTKSLIGLDPGKAKTIR